MLRALGPALGCGLMMVVCMAMMAMAGRRNRAESTDATAATASTDEISALRDEVARLRALAEERRTQPEGAP